MLSLPLWLWNRSSPSRSVLGQFLKHSTRMCYIEFARGRIFVNLHHPLPPARRLKPIKAGDGGLCISPLHRCSIRRALDPPIMP
jgi:hypothetical protein